MNIIEKKWHAWYNCQPGSPVTLIVSGNILEENLSISYVLERHLILESFPPKLVLKLNQVHILIPRERAELKVLYSEPSSIHQYVEIRILDPKGKEIERTKSDDIDIVM